ncbi:AMP-binding protein [Candidatus Neptunochlamydia vexilliferae]|uniref:Carrier domain-containing protein n=1 Tax=Candidatus Neptunichlamydia vexilliferae TaxID=1651774 RepID=A0ABS0AWV9_9BACT|nr:AMP-binding protein [Candidatus Neptunochlamydia vexilliferae]MBF5058601.1 hypothetical protein [Candidatus Neptunochlamydia vexilliferae]
MSDLSKRIRAIAEKYESKRALTYYHRFRINHYTYGELYQLALKCIGYFIENGGKKGDRILICADNGPQWVVLLFAAALGGLTLVPIDRKSSPEFLAKVTAETAPKWTFLGLDDLFSLIEEADPVLPHWEVLDEDLFEIVYTSGTTAAPKGIKIQHCNLSASIASVQAFLSSKFQGTLLSMLPLSHVLEQTAGCLATLSFGARIIYTQQVRFSRIAQILKEEKVTHVVAVPAILKNFQKNHSPIRWLSYLPFFLRRLLSFPVRKKLGRHFKAFICGGAPLSSFVEDFWENLGIKVAQGYGLTESCGIATGNTFKKRQKGSVGRPFPGQEVKLGAQNEVLLKGKNIICEDEWYHTGDVGRFDKKGNLYIVGRLKEMILTSNGLNVFPSDIEKILSRSPAIKECAVFEDPTKEGRLIGGVILNADTDLKELLQKANLELASHQQVSALVPWSQPTFPKTPSLKIKRGQLPKIYAQTAATPEQNHTDPLLRIIGAIANVPADTLTPETVLTKDLGLDSLNFVDLTLKLEAEFRTSIDEALFAGACTIQKVREALDTSPEEPPPLPRFYYSQVGSGIRQAFHSCLQHGLIRRWLSFKTAPFPKLDLNKPTIFIANHSSHLDSLSILTTLPRSIRNKILIAAAYDYFFGKEKKGGLLMHPLMIPIFPFHREKYFSENLKNLGKFLSQGRPLLIFPEGTRSRSGTLAPFKPGIGMIVKEMGAQVVPTYISGAYKLWPPSASLPKRGTIAVRYGAPLTFDKEDSPEAITKVLEKNVRALGEIQDRI